MNKKDKKRILYSIPVLLLLVRCHPETNIAVLPQNGALENDGIDEAELQKNDGRFHDCYIHQCSACV